jgi:phage-related holin
MRSLLSVLQQKKIFLTGFVAGWFEVYFLPKPMLLFFLFGAILVDFITGLVKSWSKGVATSSSGFRKTVMKLGGYLGAIIGMWFMSNVLMLMYPQKVVDYSVLVNGTIGFLTFIEFYSIFENVYEFNPNSYLSRFFIKRVMRLLKGKLENDHPIKNIEDEKQD